MKKVETESNSWDDLIFENRNHEYGAYAVRKAYPSSVNRATTVTLGLAAAIAAYSFVATNKRVIPDPPIVDGTTILDRVVQIIPQTQPKPPAQIRRTQGKLPPVPTANIIEEVEPHVETEAFTGGNETGTDVDFVEGALTGTTVEETVELPAVVDDKVYVGGTEVAAMYAGGLEALYKFVSKNIKYPAISRRIGTEGSVFVSFIVGKSGEILDAQVIKGIDASCDAEALRVIKLMKEWTPGRQGGVPVKVRMVLPITFKLSR